MSTTNFVFGLFTGILETATTLEDNLLRAFSCR